LCGTTYIVFVCEPADNLYGICLSDHASADYGLGRYENKHVETSRSTYMAITNHGEDGINPRGRVRVELDIEPRS
jgi:hypothetical protein